MNRKRKDHPEVIKWDELPYDILLEYDYYKRIKHKEKTKVIGDYIQHAKYLAKHTNERYNNLLNDTYRFATTDHQINYFVRVEELSKQILDFLFQQGEDREYNLKTVQGYLSSYSLIFITRYSLLNILTLSENHRRNFDDYEFLRENFLIYFGNIPIDSMNQYQLMIFIQGLQRKWNSMSLDNKLIDLLYAIESRIAWIVTNRHNPQDRILDETNDLYVRSIKVTENTIVLICTPIYIERVTCVISSFHYQIQIQQLLKSIFTESFTTPFDSICTKEKAENFRKFLRSEVLTVEDETFRDRIKNSIIENSVRVGERTVYTSMTKGVQASDELSILEKTRTPMQSFMVSHTIPTKYRHSKEVYDLEVIELVDMLAMNRCQFDWKKNCTKRSDEVLKDLEDILLSQCPLILRIMKYFIVVYKKKMYVSDNFQYAVFIWCYFIKNECESKWTTENRVFDLRNMVDLLYHNYLVPTSNNSETVLETVGEDGVLHV